MKRKKQENNQKKDWRK